MPSSNRQLPCLILIIYAAFGWNLSYCAQTLLFRKQNKKSFKAHIHKSFHQYHCDYATILSVIVRGCAKFARKKNRFAWKTAKKKLPIWPRDFVFVLSQWKRGWAKFRCLLSLVSNQILTPRASIFWSQKSLFNTATNNASGKFGWVRTDG